jgi:hypothetical protein
MDRSRTEPYDAPDDRPDRTSQRGRGRHVHSIFLKLGLRRGTQMHARVLATRAWLSAHALPPAAEDEQRAA